MDNDISRKDPAGPTEIITQVSQVSKKSFKTTLNMSLVGSPDLVFWAEFSFKNVQTYLSEGSLTLGWNSQRRTTRQVAAAVL